MGYYNYNIDLGKKLKELRNRCGKTIEQIAEEVNFDPRTISKYERGMMPRVSTYHKYLDALGVSDEERIELVQLAYGRR